MQTIVPSVCPHDRPSVTVESGRITDVAGHSNLVQVERLR